MSIYTTSTLKTSDVDNRQAKQRNAVMLLQFLAGGIVHVIYHVTPAINIAHESGIKLKTILICDLIAREWQKSYEITRIKVYCTNKRESPFATIVSMIAKGDGPSDRI